MKHLVSIIIALIALVTSQQVNAQIQTCKFCNKVIRAKNHSCPEMREAMRRQNQSKPKAAPVLEKEEALGTHSIIITYDESTATVKIDSSACKIENNSCKVPLKKGEYEIILVNAKKEGESPYILNQRADDIYKEAESLKKVGRVEEANLKFKKALDIYKKAAEKGNRDAQYSLAYQYHHGQGTEKNLSEALLWYSKSADNGRASAQKVMGAFYLNGEMGLIKDVNKGMDLLGKAAANYSKNANSKKQDQKLASQTYDLMIEEIEKMDDKESNEYRDSIVSDLVNSSRKAIIVNDLENALALLDKGMKLQEDNPYFVSYHGMIKVLNGEYEDAYEYYKKNRKQYKSRLLEDLNMFEKEVKNMTSGCKTQIVEIKKLLMR